MTGVQTCALPILVSVMYANNEVGSLFPIRDVVEKAHQVGAWVHCDAVQALGKSLVDLKDLGVDLASFSSHKFYALKGSGFLYSKKGLTLESLIHGGGQERFRRAGTENVLAAASLGQMCRDRSTVGARMKRVRALRDELEQLIVQEISDVEITAQNAERLDNTMNVLIPGVDGETLLMNLDMKGFCVSTGAACSSGNPEPSPVLLAMGLSRDEAQSSLRVGLGWGNRQEEVHRFVEALKQTVTKLRSIHTTNGKLAYGL